MITLTIPEAQLVEWVRQLDPDAKRTVLLALIPTLEEDEGLVEYGMERARAVALRRGLDWDRLNDRQRAALVDEVLHEEGIDICAPPTFLAELSHGRGG